MLDSGMFDRFAKEYEPDDMIFCEFEPGNEFYLLQSGRVKITKIIQDREKIIDILEPGDIFGEMAILEEQPRSASAIAMEKIKVLQFNKENFEVLLKSNPQLAMKLLVVFSKRIFDAKRRLMILLLPEENLKVIDTLNMLAEKHPHYGKMNEISVKTKIEEVAHWSALSENDVKNILFTLNRSGKIELFQDKIIIKNSADFRRQVNSRRKRLLDK